jgi:general secretion pathway protein E
VREIDTKRLKDLIKDPAKNLSTINIMLKNKLITKEKLSELIAAGVIEGEYSFADVKNYPFADRDAVLRSVASHLQLEYVDLDSLDFNYKFAIRLPFQRIVKYSIIPIEERKSEIVVAFSDPLDVEAKDFLRRTINKRLEVVVASEEQVREYLKKLEIEKGMKDVITKIHRSLHTTEDQDGSAILELIELVVKTSIDMRSSDIHIEPSEHSCIIRNRVDGVLIRTFLFERDIYAPLSSRIKLLANLDIAEKRLPQDGRFSYQIAGTPYDFRVSTLPIVAGESIVIRILDSSKATISLSQTGMVETNYERLFRALKSSYGIVLVTGPTGSGKTTTLYGALNELKSVKDKIITVEDPVEYQVEMIQQVNVNKRAGLDFAKTLKAILRQDPDKIMIGEIRDHETLRIAIEAALTGHLVLSTLHTNDAVSSITRMLDMGIEPYLLGGALVTVQAQRLVRKICPKCKTVVTVDPSSLNEKIANMLPEDNSYTFYKGTGCNSCAFTGYMGREMVCEVLEITDKMASMISANEPREAILEEAIKSYGFKTIVDIGLEKALQGITTIDEVLRVTKS